MNVARIHDETLLEKMEAWESAHWLDQDALRPITTETRQQIRDLSRQLDGYTLPPYPRTDADELARRGR